MSDEIICICRGGQNTPSRYWDRGFCTNEELDQLKREGWILDNTPYKLKVEDYPTK